MAGDYCTMASCGFCGRCDAPWDTEPEEIDDEPDAEFQASLMEATEEMIRRATNEETYLRAARGWFKETA